MRNKILLGMVRDILLHFSNHVVSSVKTEKQNIPVPLVIRFSDIYII